MHLSLIALLIVAGSAMTAQAGTFVYVSKGPENEIQVFRREGTGLKSVATYKVDGAPGSLTTDPAKRYLFATLRSVQKLASYRIDKTSGEIEFLSSISLPEGENAAFVATDRTGRWLISASYSAGKVVVTPIDVDGKLNPPVQTIKTAKTAHCVAVDQFNRWVYVPHVEPNAVYQFRFEGGRLAEAGKAPGGAEKAGPRHLAFHPKQPWAYTSDESGSSITAYQIDDKKGLSPTQTLSTLPADFKANNSTAEVKVHPNGRFVWVSNRGHDSLAGFSIAGDGKLTAIGQTPTEKTPRSFDIDPAGDMAYGAGEGSGKLAVFSLNPESGAMTRTATLEIGKSLSWVMAIER
ncbi:MAG: beta-propeller fold lactonase family protein [Planctomycetaceae bacterium]|nr:beta-propeller fold lactonase family protein [Planctomycetaceae bacterium]